MFKDRVTQHINFIEKATDEVKKLSSELNDIAKSLEKEDDEGFKVELFKSYKVVFMHSSLLYKDIEKSINCFIEAYTCAKMNGEKFSQEEDSIYDKYLEDTRSTFVLDKGKIVPSSPGLVDMLKVRFEGDNSLDGIDKIIEMHK